MEARRSFRLVCEPGDIPAVESLLEAQGFRFEPEPFWPSARRLTAAPFAPGRSLAAFFGFIYLQDRSSMLPPLALAPEPGARVLDMCASPGSKTGLLAQLIGKEGLVLGNEPGRSRLATLRRNLLTLNLLHAVTCSWPGESLPFSGGGWDRILLDPPCSGWGTLEKHPRVLKLWKGDKIRPLIALQRRLLAEAFRLLRPGGRLVYSTCTTNVEENERQIHFAREELGFVLRPLEAFPGFGFVAPEAGADGTLRVDERVSAAQGFFVALLEKPGGFSVPEVAAPSSPLPFVPVPQESIAAAGLEAERLPPGVFGAFGDTVRFLPAAALESLPAALRWQGAVVGRMAGLSFAPSSRLRAFGSGSACLASGLPRLDLDEIGPIEGLLQGRSLAVNLPGKEALLFWRGLALGRVRLGNGRALWTEK